MYEVEVILSIGKITFPHGTLQKWWQRIVPNIMKNYNNNDNNNDNNNNNKTLGEKETYKYMGILEVDTIKQVEMKEKKLKRNNSGERRNYSKPNYKVEWWNCRPKENYTTAFF